jgi:hypothetical protein
MRRAWILMAAAALFGACTSGSGGCDGGQKSSDGGDSSASSGGSGTTGGGGGEAVSFQHTGMGQKAASAAVAASTTTAAVAASSGAASGLALKAPKLAAALHPKAAKKPKAEVLCDGFPGLPDDCMASPQLAAIQRKCCPDGFVFACRAIPGGAKLTGRGCAAP